NAATRLLALVLAVVLAAPLAAQAPQDQAATLLLNSARRAYNEKNHAFAAAHFREFLQKYGGHKEANSARSGPALCLIAGPDPNKDIPADLEWAARARCDQAEMLTRLLRPKDALSAVAPFLHDRLLGKSRYRRLALYHHGFGSYLLKDYLAAGKSLNQLTPFA